MTAANCRCVKRVSGGNMATWNSRGLRGSTLEEFINRTNEIYQENGLALIQKIPTPITPNTDTFPLANIHEHQVAFMENFEKQGGVSFFLLSFTKRDEFYYLRLDMLLEFWKRAKEGGRKSFRYEELDPEYFLPRQRGVLVPYLDALQKDLLRRD